MGIFQNFGLKEVINGSGKMTALGGSASDISVAEAMQQGLMSYVEMESLYARFGEEVARFTGAADGCPTSGAAAGVAIAVAATIAGENITRIEQLPDSEGMQNEIVIQAGHCIHFGANIAQMIRLGGGRVVSVGSANRVTEAHIVEAINERTAALMYIQSHHAVQKGMCSVERMRDLAIAHGIPLIIDAAAEEDLRAYVALGADAVIYSGGKAIEGPTSGFIAGTKPLMRACRLQYKGIARAMKVSKEAMAGLLQALRNYEVRVSKTETNLLQMNAFIRALEPLDCVNVALVQDEAGREIYRACVTLKDDAPLSAVQLNERLQSGNPAIYLRDYYANVGKLYVDPRPLLPGQEQTIAQEIIRHLSRSEAHE
ncbi:MAG: DgaE family pyridoxal phosphate-dependent ammonia lyase [Bacilli bacterium]